MSPFVAFDQHIQLTAVGEVIFLASRHQTHRPGEGAGPISIVRSRRPRQALTARRSCRACSAGSVGLSWAGNLGTVARTSRKPQCSWRSEQLATTWLELTKKGPSVDR
jgi:hypothetical protein